MAVLGWLCVVAVAVAAVRFGQTARTTAARYPPGRLPSRVRTGIAVSISGPLVATGTGLLLALGTGDWALAAATTVAAIGVSAVLGLVLVP